MPLARRYGMTAVCQHTLRDGHVTIDTEGMSDGTVNIAIVDRRTLHVYAERMAFVRRAAVH